MAHVDLGEKKIKPVDSFCGLPLVSKFSEYRY